MGRLPPGYGAVREGGGPYRRPRYGGSSRGNIGGGDAPAQEFAGPSQGAIRPGRGAEKRRPPPAPFGGGGAGEAPVGRPGSVLPLASKVEGAAGSDGGFAAAHQKGGPLHSGEGRGNSPAFGGADPRL